MDLDFFRERLHALNMTQGALASALRIDRSMVSKILSGERRLKLEEVAPMAAALGISVDDVVEHAGLAAAETVKAIAGRAAGRAAAGDASRWDPPAGEARGRVMDMAGLLGGGRPGLDIWQVQGRSMLLDGYAPGDFMLVDLNAAERARPGDVVIAQAYDNPTGSAATLLRRYEPPVLVAATPEREQRLIHVVDNANVVIRGVVVASWRGGIRH